MRIAMFTNTYTPHVGGVAGSVQSFTLGYRARGHNALVVAPVFENTPENEEDVVRMPAIQHFNGSDFSVTLPAPHIVTEALNNFQPEVVHSHHPFLLGDTALRVAASRNLPIVFTHHTMYEQYTHYVPGDMPAFARFIKTLSTGYANLCDHVVAPSESVMEVLRERGVETPITVIPTGVDIDKFAGADGAEFRNKRGIPLKAFVVGHVGRLAPEKNLSFLAEAVCYFLHHRPDAHFLCVGDGPSRETMERICSTAMEQGRVHFTGKLVMPELAQAYAAMDVFAFASKSETQGMVLTEAMGAGIPVIAIDAPGAREVLHNTSNGRLLRQQSVEGFAAALDWAYCAPQEKRKALCKAARKTAEQFSWDKTVLKATRLYEKVIAKGRHAPDPENATRTALLRSISEEWNLWSNRLSAAVSMFTGDEVEDVSLPRGARARNRA